MPGVKDHEHRSSGTGFCHHRVPLPSRFSQPWLQHSVTVTTPPTSDSVPVDLSPQVFRVKAIKLGEKLLPAFNTPTGIPKGVVNFKR